MKSDKITRQYPINIKASINPVQMALAKSGVEQQRFPAQNSLADKTPQKHRNTYGGELILNSFRLNPNNIQQLSSSKDRNPPTNNIAKQRGSLNPSTNHLVFQNAKLAQNTERIQSLTSSQIQAYDKTGNLFNGNGLNSALSAKPKGKLESQRDVVQNPDDIKLQRQKINPMVIPKNSDTRLDATNTNKQKLTLETNSNFRSRSKSGIDRELELEGNCGQISPMSLLKTGKAHLHKMTKVDITIGYKTGETNNILGCEPLLKTPHLQSQLPDPKQFTTSEHNLQQDDQHNKNFLLVLKKIVTDLKCSVEERLKSEVEDSEFDQVLKLEARVDRLRAKLFFQGLRQMIRFSERKSRLNLRYFLRKVLKLK